MPGSDQVQRGVNRSQAADLDWERGKAWAFEQVMRAVRYYAASNIAMTQMGRHTLERIHLQVGPQC